MPGLAVAQRLPYNYFFFSFFMLLPLAFFAAACIRSKKLPFTANFPSYSFGRFVLFVFDFDIHKFTHSL